MENRRNFFRKVVLASVAISLPASGAFSAVQKKGKNKKINLKKGAVILFQGDSVTDCGRDYTSAGKWPLPLGNGYPQYVAMDLVTQYPGYDFKIYNRGISGNKVYQLRDRWQTQCLDMKPDVLSILIGVNDYWHSLSDYKGTPEIYENDYRALLQLTKKELPNVKLIIGEPIALYGVGVVTEEWRPEMKKYQAIAKKLAEEFDAVFIPYQSIFEEAETEGKKYGIPSSYWTGDGVHPTQAGHVLIANSIMEVLK